MDLTDFFRVYNQLIKSAYEAERSGNKSFALDKYKEAINLCKMCDMPSDDAEEKYNKCANRMGRSM